MDYILTFSYLSQVIGQIYITELDEKQKSWNIGYGSLHSESTRTQHYKNFNVHKSSFKISTIVGPKMKNDEAENWT